MPPRAAALFTPVLVAVAAVGAGACRPEVCAPAAPPPAAEPRPRPEGAGAHVFAHAHNDYEHEHPLADALAARFYSVEADVYLDQGRIRVSHDGLSWKGDLDALYLDPLKARVAATGSVYGDDLPFTLWIDLKQGSAELQDALAGKLAAYPMLTRYNDGAPGVVDGLVEDGPVTVILTGDAGAKRALTARPAPRPYTRDDNDFHLDDPDADTRWTSYALAWGSYVSWDGNGAIAADEKARVLCLVDGAHARGRSLRFFATPETTGYWQLALDAGVDFINTDDLAGLSAFLDAH